MSAIEYVQATVIPSAAALLPAKMDSAPARAMLLAIGLQESRFLHRRQIGGPARGFWQFERGGGVSGVLRHPASRPLLGLALPELFYESAETGYLHEAIAHHDVLACVFARLLLWTLPGKLPERGEHDGSWEQYLDAWRPGKPHPSSWQDFYDQAWGLVAP